MTALILSADKEAGFEVTPVVTKKTIRVQTRALGSHRVSAKRFSDGRIFVKCGCRTNSVEYWRQFGHKIIDENLTVPGEPRSFAKALESQAEYEVPDKGWFSMVWSMGPVTADTKDAVKVEQAERVSRARKAVERETAGYQKAVRLRERAHELLEPMLAEIERALA